MLKKINKNREEFLWPMGLSIAIFTPLIFVSGYHLAIIVSVVTFSLGILLFAVSESIIRHRADQIIQRAKKSNIHLDSQVQSIKKLIDSSHCHNHWLVHQIAAAIGIDENASIEEKWQAIRKDRHCILSLMKHMVG